MCGIRGRNRRSCASWMRQTIVRPCTLHSPSEGFCVMAVRPPGSRAKKLRHRADVDFGLRRGVLSLRTCRVAEAEAHTLPPPSQTCLPSTALKSPSSPSATPPRLRV
ncbi:hypothetical protein PHLGIDRAFT_385265 [Phlebiopsis gigantea 11061_1 CR5-6]|uniref:Uncharacterized protein n=1 Tax=Phlebiopsis gigantea (strain 11061_1 CR5-6) TaxID=745531 RepID=A0A0C3S0A5_PHLG1|nr:hypothetical protein PHLGIDRAFT_385265 [Phlebiopsis gigantea 11061_1 CR5-6]